MNGFYEKQTLSGIVQGIVTTSDLNLSIADYNEWQAIYGVICKIENKGLKPDVDLIYQEACSLDEYFDKKDISALAQMPVSASVCFSSAQQLRQHSLKTELSEKLTVLLGNTETKTGAVMLKELQNLCGSLESNYSELNNNFVSLDGLADKAEKVYTDLHNNISFAVPTCFAEVDELILDGFGRGDLSIIVGFTGSGKSSLALNFAKNQAKSGYKVGIVSREMSDIENFIRLQVSETNTPRWYIRKGLYAQDYQKLVNNLKEFRKLPILINTATTTIEHLRFEVKQLCENEGLDILYVDYLQLMTSNKKHSTRANEVQTISRTLKEIAMENKIPVVALCQFNRGAVNSNIFEIMYQLKESSGLEQDASTILLVDVEKTQERVREKNASVTVLKNRNGTPFVPCNLRFIGELFLFESVLPESVDSYYEKD